MSEATTGLTPDQKLLKKYEDKFSACASARQRFEREWYFNMAFYFGRQYVEWTRSLTEGSGITLSVPKLPAWRVRHISNKIRPIVRKELTKLGKEQPQFFTVPETQDDEDISKARVADAVAEYIILNAVFNRKRRHATWWASVTGNGFFKTYYDPNEVDDAGYQGQIKIEAITPFHLWVPNLENPELESQPYVFHSVALTPEDVESKYGVKLEADSSSKPPEHKFLSGLGINNKHSDIQQVFVKEVWIKPNRDFPNGAMFTMAQKKMLYMQEELPEYDGQGVLVEQEGLPSNTLGGRAPASSWPYEHRRYPFTKIDHIPSGKFYSDSVITDLIPLQKDYNRSRSQTMEARNLTSKPQFTVPRGSIDVKKLTSQPGLIIEYTPGFDPPRPVINPEQPGYVMQSEQQTQHDMDYISNQFEVTQGRTPPGIEAASAIAYLQEENDTILMHTVASLEEAVADVGYKALCLAKEKWDEERLITIVSGQNAFEAILFKRESMPNNIDFRVESGSMAPRSKAAKQAFITELLKLGAIPPMEALKYLEMNETNRLYADLQVDTRQAQRENYKMEKGMQIPTNPFDNHVGHIVAHERYMKGQEYEALPDEIKQIFLMHHQEHLVKYGQQTEDNLEPTNQNQGPVENNG